MDRVTDLTTGLQIGLKPVNSYELTNVHPGRSFVLEVPDFLLFLGVNTDDWIAFIGELFPKRCNNLELLITIIRRYIRIRNLLVVDTQREIQFPE